MLRKINEPANYIRYAVSRKLYFDSQKILCLFAKVKRKIAKI